MLICSQEESPGTHKSPQEIAPMIGISRSSVKRLVKRRGYKLFKRLKTPRMSETTRQRRIERSGRLADCFEKKNPRLIENVNSRTKRTLCLRPCSICRMTEFTSKEIKKMFQKKICFNNCIESPKR